MPRLARRHGPFCVREATAREGPPGRVTALSQRSTGDSGSERAAEIDRAAGRPRRRCVSAQCCDPICISARGMPARSRATTRGGSRPDQTTTTCPCQGTTSSLSAACTDVTCALTRRTDLDDWSEHNPSRGQCAVTALVVQDLLGGALLLAPVHHADGTRQGVHYWNRFDGGVELDLTRDQFKRGEVIGSAEIAARPRDLDQGRLAEQYRVLSERVSSRLAQ